jgi:hypothetical protein
MARLQSPACQCYVRFEVFTAVTMKNGVFWDVALVRTNVSVFLHNVHQLLVTANVVLVHQFLSP